MERGSYTRSIPSWPTETGTNWATIATGAHPATHGCAFVVHEPGEPLDKFRLGFPSTNCRAEQLWQVMDSDFRTSIIFDYPQSLPLNINKVIHVGEDGCPGPHSKQEVASGRGYVTRPVPSQFTAALSEIEITPATDWRNLPPNAHKYFSAELPIVSSQDISGGLDLAPLGQIKLRTGIANRIEGAAATFYLLILPNAAGEYAQVALCTERDYAQCLGHTRVGEWSEWLTHTFAAGQGTIRASFRGKLLALDANGQNVHFYLSQIYPIDGFTHPPELASQLVQACGPYLHRPNEQKIVIPGACDITTFDQETAYTAEWYGRAASYCMQNYEWDAFFLKWHPIDFMQHICWDWIDPIHPLHDPSRAAEGWKYFADYYEIGDRLVASILENLDPSDIVVVVSDHGQISSIYAPYPHLLHKEGLVVRGEDGEIDWTRSRAFCNPEGIWVNLKGRDPQGIVEPGEEYERIREQIVEILLNDVYQPTGQHTFNLVCKKEDAAFMGVGGDRAPDVIACLAPLRGIPMTPEEYELGIADSMWDVSRGTHGPQLGSTHLSVGGIESFFLVAGPGVKKGYRRDRSINQVDIAPTLAHLVGLRAPKNAEGRVIADFLDE
jgi:predicted AlkP superfamily phosphohydrolase/phosphomutase